MSLRRTQLYLFRSLRENFKKTISDMALITKERLFSQFLDIESDANKYGEERYKHYGQLDLGPDADYSDFSEAANEERIDYYFLLSVMRYRTLAMAISLLSQVWEQQLFSFVLSEAEHERIAYSPKDVKRDFGFSKKAFRHHGQEMEKMQCWFTLNEMRTLVNVMKHGEGDSEVNLRQINPKYFSVTIGAAIKFEPMKINRNALVQENLNVEEEDYDRFVTAVIEFWDELPERMYSA